MTDRIDAIDYYWRPGCGFCMSLGRKLEKLELPVRRHNIWDDPDAAAVVRSVANGNETVPTVVVGDVALVNPRIDQVLDAIAREAPDLVPPDRDPAPGRVSSLVGRLRGG